jgi:hypothetical protein
MQDGWKVIGLDINQNETVGFEIITADVSNYNELASAFHRVWRDHGRLDFGSYHLVFSWCFSVPCQN